MKRLLSVLCALSVIASVSSCAENTPVTPNSANAAQETTTSEANRGVGEENSVSSVTSQKATVTNTALETTVMYTTDVTTATDKPVAKTTTASEMVSPGYDPGLPDVYLNIETYEIYPDTEQVVFSINSGSSADVGYCFNLERVTENGLEKLEKIKNQYTPALQPTITPDSPLVLNIYPNDYGISFKRGEEYRISIESDGKEYDTYFVVGERIPPLKKGDIALYIEGTENLTVDNLHDLQLHYTYVGDAEYAEYGFGCDYRLEKLNNSGIFEPVEFSENAAFIELGYLISTDYPTNSTTVYLNNDFYAEPLTAGTYKVIKPIDSNVTLTGLFRINDKYNYTPEPAEGDLKMFVFQTMNNIPITTDTEFIDVEFSFMSSNYDYAEFMYGSEYMLEKLEGGEWRTIAFNDDIAWDAMAYIINSNNPIPCFSVPIKDNKIFAEPITEGKYRVKKTVSGTKDYYAEFEIINKNSVQTEYNYPVESENGSITLTINEMRADKLICSLPWPYPATYTVQCFAEDYADLCANDNIDVEYTTMYKVADWEYLIIPSSISHSTFQIEEDVCYKPVIYLYPEEQTDVSVKLDYNGELTVTYPEYGNGWNVTAMPDGTLYDKDGNEYSYLFWEGKNETVYDFSKGFCVKGEDTAEFLREKLSLMGLTPREYNEFIVFWLPFMKDNEYNIISFQGDCYTDNAVLNVTPAPDTVLRVFMAFKPSDIPVDIEEQVLYKTERNGFTLVEWGGALTR